MAKKDDGSVGTPSWQIKLLREQIERMRKDPGDVPFTACDHSCVCAQATGMATNGGCRCDERTLRRAVMYWRGRAQFLQATLQMMRDGCGDCKVCGSSILDSDRPYLCDQLCEKCRAVTT